MQDAAERVAGSAWLQARSRRFESEGHPSRGTRQGLTLIDWVWREVRVCLEQQNALNWMVSEQQRLIQVEKNKGNARHTDKDTDRDTNRDTDTFTDRKSLLLDESNAWQWGRCLFVHTPCPCTREGGGTPIGCEQHCCMLPWLGHALPTRANTKCGRKLVCGCARSEGVRSV